MKKYIFIVFALIAAFIANAQTIKGTYAIKNAATGMVLRIKDANSKNGTPIVSYSPVNWKCVTWDFRNIEGKTYQLINLFSGKTFQSGQLPAEGVLMEEQPVVEQHASQLYEFLPDELNTYLIRLKGTDLYLTPEDENGKTNSGILLAKRKKGSLQNWKLEEQHPTI